MGEREKGVTSISVENAKLFVFEALKSVGTPDEAAFLCADVLIEADRRGHFSHGMNILHKILMDIMRNLIDCKAQPEILSESPSTAWIDGKNGLGPVVADFCMQLAIKKAKEVGFAVVSAKGSSNPSIMGYWSEYALKHDCIGMTFTNAAPMMVPTRAKEGAVGPNPIAFAAPSHGNDSFSLDMATSTVSGGKIEICRRKREPLVKGWAFNEKGILETDSEIAVKKMLLVPLGGLENTAGYKGYGLSCMVEIFCGILSGSKFGPQLDIWSEDRTEPADVGHCFMAINIENFAPYFRDRLHDLLLTHRKCEPVDLSKPVLIPGDPARMYRKKVAKQQGIRYSQQQINTCQIFANILGIKPLQCQTSN
ncbi:uncharacterized oxidoreductase YjmC-like [Coccinella septempunctata]|uniref:uncharacterized oxidoreductase YjmC-like n=1 Tax=Coccinella septempunctata TaxID=41139 RepID=UPI001D065BE6|nr:uncharacterized oxidoreductase YjmC-like [Coccinella septempunctata]